MADHLTGRDRVTEALRRELLGPAPAGRPLDTTGSLTFDQKEQSYGPWTVAATGQEILDRDPPVRRYGVGVLFPDSERPRAEEPDSLSETADASGEDEVDALPAATVSPLGDGAQEDLREIAERGSARFEDLSQDASDFDLTAANDRRQSAIAVTFLARLADGATVTARVAGGRYYPLTVMVAGSIRTWWARESVALDVEFDLGELRSQARTLVAGRVARQEGLGSLQLDVRALSRPRENGEWLITAFAKNTTPPADNGSLDERCLFQVEFQVRAVDADDRGAVLPYPDQMDATAPNQQGEDASFELLYRESRTFAIGHGCAGEWEADADGERASCVLGSVFPVVETRTTTPDIYDQSDPPRRLRVSMARLAGLDADNDGFDDAEAMLAAYETWITKLDPSTVPTHLRPVADAHLEQCDAALGRMRAGLAFIRSDAAARPGLQACERSGAEPATPQPPQPEETAGLARRLVRIRRSPITARLANDGHPWLLVAIPACLPSCDRQVDRTGR